MTTIQNDFTALLLRLALGVMYLAHGLTKLLVFTPTGTAHFFESLGFPGYVGYLIILFEIGAGLFLLLGIITRLVSFLAFLQMLVITYVHFPNGWSFTNSGGGWEYPAFMAVIALSLTLLGGGRFSLSRAKNHQN